MATPEHSGDHARLWLGEQPRRILAALEDAVLDGGGLLLLTGDPGVGKTTLAKALISRLAERAVVVRLARPPASVPVMIEALGNGFGVDVPERTPANFVRGLRELLDSAVGQEQRVLIIVDEAHDFAPDALAALEQLLSPDASAFQQRLSILLVGQEQLVALVEQPPSHLKRFVTLSEQLRTLDAAEVASFVRHRLAISSLDLALFTDDAIRAIEVMSAGVPRLVVRLCEVAPIGRAAKKRIDARTIQKRAERFGVLPRGPVAAMQARSIDVAAAGREARIRVRFVPRNLARPVLGALVVVVGIAAVSAFASRGLLKADPGSRLPAPSALPQKPVASGPIPTPVKESPPRPSLPVDSSVRSRSSEPPAAQLPQKGQRAAATPEPVAAAPRTVASDTVHKPTGPPRSTASPPRVVAGPELSARPSQAESPPRSRTPEGAPEGLGIPAEPRTTSSRSTGAVAAPVPSGVVPEATAKTGDRAAAPRGPRPTATSARSSGDPSDAWDPAPVIDWLLRRAPSAP